MTRKKEVAVRKKYSLECPYCHHEGKLRAVKAKNNAGNPVEVDVTLTTDGIPDTYGGEPLTPRLVWCQSCSSNDFNVVCLELPDEKELAAIKVPDVAKVTAAITKLMDTASFAPRPMREDPSDAIKESFNDEDKMAQGKGQDYTSDGIGSLSIPSWNTLVKRITDSYDGARFLCILMNWDEQCFDVHTDKERAAEAILQLCGKHIELFAFNEDGDRYRMAGWEEEKFFVEDFR